MGDDLDWREDNVLKHRAAFSFDSDTPGGGSEADKTLLNYKGKGFAAINTALRDGTASPAISMQIDSLADLCNHSTAKVSFLAYRGVKGDEKGGIVTAPIGSVIENRGFTSTSTEYNVARTSQFSSDAVVEILIPRNTAALSYIAYRGFTEKGTPPYMHLDSEYEVILPPGARFLKLREGKDSQTGRYSATLLLLSPGMELGGPGSGNWGHAGRPGKRGGSAPGGGSHKKTSAINLDGKIEALRESYRRLQNTSLDWNSDPQVSDEATVKEKVQFATETFGIDDLGSDAKWALSSYTGAGHHSINGILRHPEEWASERLESFREETREKIALLDSAFQQPGSVCRRSCTVYRGGGDRELMEKLNVGDTLRDNGFCSTSISPRQGASFNQGSGIIATIYLPAGTRAITIVGRADFSTTEAEVLLSRGQPFQLLSKKVVKRQMGNGNVYPLLHVELLALPPDITMAETPTGAILLVLPQ